MTKKKSKTLEDDGRKMGSTLMKNIKVNLLEIR